MQRKWEIFDERGRTALHHSAEGCYDDCIKALPRLLEREEEAPESR